MKHKKAMAVVIVLGAASVPSASAHDSTCPDYAEHSNVLKFGNQKLSEPGSGGFSSSQYRPLYDYGYYMGPRHFRGKTHREFRPNPEVIKYAESRISEFENHKNARNFIGGAVMGACLQLWLSGDADACIAFGEKYLPKIGPEYKKFHLNKLLANAYVVKTFKTIDTNSTKKFLNMHPLGPDNLREMNRFYDQQALHGTWKLTDKQRTDFVTAKKYYLESIPDGNWEKEIPAFKTPELVPDSLKKGLFWTEVEARFRLAVISEVLDDKPEILRWKNETISFLRDYEKMEVKETQFDEYAKKQFKNDPASGHALPSETQFANGLIQLCKRQNYEQDLDQLTLLWAQKWRRLDLIDNCHVEMISRLSDSLKPRLYEGGFEIATESFGPVYDAFQRKSWTKEAGVFEDNFIASQDNYLTKVLDHLFKTKDTKSAFNIVHSELNSVENKLKGDEEDFARSKINLAEIKDDLKLFKVADDAISLKIRALEKQIEYRAEQLKCLELAKRLCRTGWNLIVQGDGKTAYKMYLSALDIRKKNLPSDDRLIAATHLEMAQAAALDNNLNLAEPHFQQAITIYKVNSIPNDNELQCALEHYGNLLKKNNQIDRANKVFDQVRALKVKTQASES